MGMASVAMDRMSKILEAKQEDYSQPQNGIEKFKGEIEFQNVSFKYNEEVKNKVLDGVSFKIKQGEKVALIGPTGGGKSTLIALLTRFYDNYSGQILIDGKDIMKMNKTFLRKRIGVALQKAFLFSTSIKNNIAYAKPKANEQNVIDSARAASIYNVLDKFPDGFDTMVGEKGVTLSGGQKQRVSLARTLLSNPDILVLDDTTSAVDAETEFAIQDALGEKMKKRTTIIIAHRMTSIQHADRIIVLDKGKIVQMGAHEQLVVQKGFYKDVIEMQLAIEDDVAI
jgi:ATP-binding cassette subfamily B protein